MVKQTLTATIFVSSPGDVQQERDSVQTTVTKWNSRNADARGVTFKVWVWEENSVPDIGEDAQGVMNTQIPADYDILVGIFWSRLGTPTGRSGSGSQEEIENAIARKAESGSPHVAIYFKKDNYPIDEIDLSQLEKLRGFETDIKGRALVSHFTEIQSFESQIERLLDKKADEYSGGAIGLVSAALEHNPTKDVQENSQSYEDYGLFDLVEEGEKAVTAAISVLGEIGDRLNTFSTKINNITDRLQSAQQYGDVSIKRARPIVREAATEMNLLSGFIDERIDDFSLNFHAAAELSVRIVDVSGDFDDSDGAVMEFKGSLAEMKSEGERAIESQNNLRDTITSLPRLDIRTNQAKRRLSGAIDRLTDVMRAGLDRLSDF